MQRIFSVEANPNTSAVPEAFVYECTEYFAEAVQVFGVARSVGQIYGLLYASPEPLSFSEIVERLGISKGSVSQGLQLLRNLGAIRLCVSQKKLSLTSSDTPRREYFEPELSLRTLLSGVIQSRVAPLTAIQTDRLDRLRRIAAGDKRSDRFCVERAKRLEIWRRRLNTVLPVLVRILGPQSSAKKR